MIPECENVNPRIYFPPLTLTHLNVTVHLSTAINATADFFPSHSFPLTSSRQRDDEESIFLRDKSKNLLHTQSHLHSHSLNLLLLLLCVYIPLPLLRHSSLQQLATSINDTLENAKKKSNKTTRRVILNILQVENYLLCIQLDIHTHTQIDKNGVGENERVYTQWKSNYYIEQQQREALEMEISSWVIVESCLMNKRRKRRVSGNSLNIHMRIKREKWGMNAYILLLLLLLYIIPRWHRKKNIIAISWFIPNLIKCFSSFLLPLSLSFSGVVVASFLHRHFHSPPFFSISPFAHTFAMPFRLTNKWVRKKSLSLGMLYLYSLVQRSFKTSNNNNYSSVCTHTQLEGWRRHCDPTAWRHEEILQNL